VSHLLLLFEHHGVEDWQNPLLKLDVVLVGDDQVACTREERASERERREERERRDV
jgi:hypothetical protein